MLPLKGPDCWAMELAFSRDGAWLATSDANGLVQMRSLAEVEKIPRALERPYVTTFPIAFANEGKSLLLTYRDNFIKRWTPGDGSAALAMFADQYPVGGIEVSPDRKLVAIFGQGDATGTVTIHNATTGQPLATFQPQPGSQHDVTGVRFAADSQSLFVAELRIRSLAREASQTERWQDFLPRASGGQSNSEFMPGSHRVSRSRFGDSDFMPAPFALANGVIVDFKVSPNGDGLLVATREPLNQSEATDATSAVTLVRDINDTRPPTTLILDTRGVANHAVAYLANGQVVAVGGDDGLLRVFKVSFDPAVAIK